MIARLLVLAALAMSVNSALDAQTLELRDLHHRYDGRPHGASLDLPAELGASVELTYDGRQEPPVDAGTYNVRARILGEDLELYLMGRLTIDRALAPISILGTTHTYDGRAKHALVRTWPDELRHTIEYRRAGKIVEAPTEPGAYTVVVRIDDPNYQGVACAGFTIQPAFRSHSTTAAASVR